MQSLVFRLPPKYERMCFAVGSVHEFWVSVEFVYASPSLDSCDLI
jgi:hypothetical protein